MNAYVKGGIVAILVALGCVAWYLSNQDALPVNQSPARFKALDAMEKEGVPDFELAQMDGKKLRLSDYRGKIVILNFWASWCNPCVEEFPSMMKLIEEFKGEVVIVAVSSEESKPDIETFMKAFQLPKPNFNVVWDPDKAVMQKYGVEKVPESFLVGRDGKLIRKVMGIENWNTPDAIEFFRLLLAGKKA
jgi:peroxiredoxin